MLVDVECFGIAHSVLVLAVRALLMDYAIFIPAFATTERYSYFRTTYGKGRGWKISKVKHIEGKPFLTFANEAKSSIEKSGMQEFSYQIASQGGSSLGNTLQWSHKIPYILATNN